LPSDGVAVSAAVVDELLAMAAAAIASGPVEFVEPVAVLLATSCWGAEIAAAGGMTVVTCAADGCVESATPAPEATLSADLVFPGFDVVGFVPPCKFLAALSPVPAVPGAVSATRWLVPSADGLSGVLDGARPDAVVSPVELRSVGARASAGDPCATGRGGGSGSGGSCSEGGAGRLLSTSAAKLSLAVGSGGASFGGGVCNDAAAVTSNVTLNWPSSCDELEP